MICGHDIEDLILFQAEELDGVARAAVCDRLSSCAVCQHELDTIGQFAAWQAQPVEFDMAAVTAARARAYARIGGSFRVRIRRFQASIQTVVASLAPMPQIALALLLVIIGFAGGKLTSGPGSSGSQANLAQIKDIKINPATGLAVVRYDDVGEPAMIGGLDDPSMRTTLQTAIADKDSPRNRLHALRTVGYLAKAAAPDSGLVSAVLHIVREDENVAVKLRAIRALEALYQDASLPAPARSALLDVLVSDTGDGVRIAALNLLLVQDLTARDSNRLRQASQSDGNPYIRAGATSALKRIESIPLESIQ